jgi:DNA-binding transcriptional ArsR family regulator
MIDDDVDDVLQALPAVAIEELAARLESLPPETCAAFISLAETLAKRLAGERASVPPPLSAEAEDKLRTAGLVSVRFSFDSRSVALTQLGKLCLAAYRRQRLR